MPGQSLCPAAMSPCTQCRRQRGRGGLPARWSGLGHGTLHSFTPSLPHGCDQSTAPGRWGGESLEQWAWPRTGHVLGEGQSRGGGAQVRAQLFPTHLSRAPSLAPSVPADPLTGPNLPYQKGLQGQGRGCPRQSVMIPEAPHLPQMPSCWGPRGRCLGRNVGTATWATISLHVLWPLLNLP